LIQTLNNVDLMTSVNVVEGRSYEEVSLYTEVASHSKEEASTRRHGGATSILYINVSQFPHATSPASTRDATHFSKVLRSSASKRAHLWKGQRVRSSRLTRQLNHWTRPSCSDMSPGVAVDAV
jgi:hypothetical protein